MRSVTCLAQDALNAGLRVEFRRARPGVATTVKLCGGRYEGYLIMYATADLRVLSTAEPMTRTWAMEFLAKNNCPFSVVEVEEQS